MGHHTFLKFNFLKGVAKQAEKIRILLQKHFKISFQKNKIFQKCCLNKYCQKCCQKIKFLKNVAMKNALKNVAIKTNF